MISNVTKLLKESDLGSKVNAIRKTGKRIVFTNGCFDLIHAGHVIYLKEAKKQGDILILGLNSDSSIKRIKGSKRPILDQESRAIIMDSFDFVDYIIFFNEDTPCNLIKKIRPDFLVKGGDWSSNTIVGADFVKSYNGVVKSIRYIPGNSTTGIIDKIIKLYTGKNNE